MTGGGVMSRGMGRMRSRRARSAACTVVLGSLPVRLTGSIRAGRAAGHGPASLSSRAARARISSLSSSGRSIVNGQPSLASIFAAPSSRSTWAVRRTPSGTSVSVPTGGVRRCAGARLVCSTTEPWRVRHGCQTGQHLCGGVESSRDVAPALGRPSRSGRVGTSPRPRGRGRDVPEASVEDEPVRVRPPLAGPAGGQRQGVWALVVGAEQTRPACESVGRVAVDG